MGKPSSHHEFNQSSTASGNNNQSSPAINHFSHPHTLQLSYHQSQPTLPAGSCSGCELEASGLIYSCTTCNFFLHPKCSQMPQRITHPFDQKGHVLSLLSKPAYLEGLFNCDACGQEGNGFSYHCEDCGIDLHILCASLPMVLRHSSHADPLNLTFSPPYPSNNFSCDICKMAGSKNWLYRCNTCEFDVHLACVNMLPRTPVQLKIEHSLTQRLQTLMSKSIPQPSITQTQGANSLPNNFMTGGVNPVALINSLGHNGFLQAQNQASVFGTPTAAASTQAMQHLMQPNNFVNTGSTYGSAVRPVSQGNSVMNQVLGGLASGASQELARVLVHDLIGGSGGNNNGGLMQDFLGDGDGNNNGGADGGLGGSEMNGFATGDGGYGGGDPNAATY